MWNFSTMSDTRTHSREIEEHSEVLSQKWTCLRLLVILGAALVFLPLLNNSFLSDDYRHIAARLLLSDTSERFFSLYREHFLPVLFAIHLLQHYFFEATPAGFYLVSIFGHDVGSKRD